MTAATKPSARPDVLPDFSMVRLVVPVNGWGRDWPAGCRGAIVEIYDGGAAYEVEFNQPEFGLVTVTRDEIAPD